MVRPPGPAGQAQLDSEAPGLTSSVPVQCLLLLVDSELEPPNLHLWRSIPSGLGFLAVLEKPYRSSFSCTNLLALEVSDDDPTRTRRYHDSDGSDDSDPPTAVARSDVFARAV